MKTANKSSRSVVFAGAAGALALAALGFAGAAQARDNIAWSVGVGSPGVSVNVGNAFPVYAPAPVYVQPAPVYYEPAPVYYQPAPVYVQPRPHYQSYYGQPQVVYVQPGYRHGWNKHHGRDHDRDDDRGGRGYRQGLGPVNGAGWGSAGYAPVYYQR
ncbi:hypothetical protein [Polaromonas sp.]|uniref:hypothetical protein n=1 Tax=Polaromonas sp. TaxID=1869339 RepID=UPI00286BCF52|nr:hypothetical protein [Polaromonas sp.]